MGRKAHLDKPVKKQVWLPESLVAKVDLLLWSELEEKIPYGAWGKLIENLLQKHLAELKDKSK